MTITPCPRCAARTFTERDDHDATVTLHWCLSCGWRETVAPLPYVSLQPIPGGGERRGR